MPTVIGIYSQITLIPAEMVKSCYKILPPQGAGVEEMLGGHCLLGVCPLYRAVGNPIAIPRNTWDSFYVGNKDRETTVPLVPHYTRQGTPGQRRRTPRKYGRADEEIQEGSGDWTLPPWANESITDRERSGLPRAPLPPHSGSQGRHGQRDRGGARQIRQRPPGKIHHYTCHGAELSRPPGKPRPVEMKRHRGSRPLIH